MRPRDLVTAANRRVSTVPPQVVRLARAQDDHGGWNAADVKVGG